MMRAIKIDAQEAENKWHAARHAMRYSASYEFLYSAHQRAIANRMGNDASGGYNFYQRYVTYRAKFVTVKLDGAKVFNKAFVDALEANIKHWY